MLSDLARQAVLNLFINGNPTLNGAFSSLCEEQGVPVPLAPGAIPTAPFTITLSGAGPGSPTFWNALIPVDQLEAEGMIDYPFLMIGATAEKQDPNWRIRPSTFSGTIGVEMRFYLAWEVRYPPQANDFNIQLDLLDRAIFQVINGPQNQALWLPQTTAQWGDGQIIYNGDLNCTLKGPMQLTNKDALWRRELRMVATFRGIL
jgi:hypothetical protein